MSSKSTEKLTQATHILAAVCRRANRLEDVTTTVVVVTQDAEGKGVVNVYVNGMLQEVPMEMMMFAKDAYDKTRIFALATNKQGVAATAHS